MSLLRRQSGMSLVEFVVVASVFGVVMALMTATFAAHSRSNRVGLERGVTQADLRHWITRVTRDLRRAGYDPSNANEGPESVDFGFIEFRADEVRFTLDADADGTLDSNASEQIGYRLNGGDVELWLGGGTWRPILQGVDTFELSYFDKRGDTIDLSSPTKTAAAIHKVEILLVTNDGEVGLPPLTERTTVELANESFDKN